MLAGGIGSRFWPVSTPSRPKQLLPLTSPRPLIRDTVDRGRSLVPDDRLLVLTGEDLVVPFRSVLPELPRASLLVEPRARGTAPVLTWAAHQVARKDPDAILVSLHADHLITPLEAFVQTVLAAATLARRDDMLVTVAAPPDRAETGYGYVEAGRTLTPVRDMAAWDVASFHEKPDAATAADYVSRGLLWNTGIFVWRARTFLAEIQRHAPEIAPHLVHLDREDPAAFFDAVEPISVDVAVMERSDRVGTIRATFRWDDVGAWHALHRTREGDEHGNVLEGEALVDGGRDNVVWADEGRIVLFGVDDLVVVRSGETVLVTRRDRSGDLKRLLDRLPPSFRESP